jgi:hypothetical protein
MVWLAGAPGLERVVTALVKGGEQGAHPIEELQRLTAGEPLPGLRQQVGRTGPARARGLTLFPARALPGFSSAGASSTLGHRRQTIRTAQPTRRYESIPWAAQRLPRATWIIGRNDAEPGYQVLYADDRGTSRVYRMSLGEGTWAHDFKVRYTRPGE